MRSSLDRRSFLKLGATGLCSLADVPLSFGAAAPITAQAAFDHFLLGASDLDAGIQWLEERTGVRAQFGGVHPGRGTRNALASLGERHYLEIIAPDPQQPDVADERGLRKLAHPSLIGWAIGTHELDGLQRKAQRAGFKTIAGPPGSRQRPDGKLLRWRTLGLETATPLVPFVIEWSADSPHPSADAPDAGRVAQLVFETPGPEPLRKALRALGVVADIRRASEPRIRLTLATTKGRVELR